MNVPVRVEFLRRETAKKNIGLTELPGGTAGSATATIAKGLEPNDFIGMVIPVGEHISVVTDVEITADAETNAPEYIISGQQFAYVYRPRTGDLVEFNS